MAEPTPADGRILVTGATGTVGTHVVEGLQDRDANVVAAVRDPQSASEVLGDVPAVEFDFTRPETWGFAFEDATSLFLVRPPGAVSIRRDILPCVDAAIRSGVDHVVYLSVQGADRLPVLPHRRIERHLERSAARYTHLRAAFFMQNLSGVHRADVRDRDEIFVPAGGGETVFVDARDVGAVAAEALVDPQHRDRSYDVTGPAAMDYHDVAAVFSDVLGREITYPEPSTLAFLRRMLARGQDWRYALLMVLIYAPTRLGRGGTPSEDVARVLGRDPYTLREFVEAHVEEFRSG